MRLNIVLLIVYGALSYALEVVYRRSTTLRHYLTMVKNDPTTRANRAARRSGADDRIVELRKPLGLTLAEDINGNVFVKSVDANGRAEKSGLVFVGDQVKMVSATFGEDMWSCEGAGLTRVLSCIKVRNTKPVRLVLEAANEEEEKKRRAVAYKELSPSEKEANQQVSTFGPIQINIFLFL